MQHPSVETIENFKRLVKEYENITDLIKKSKQRLRAQHSDLSNEEQNKIVNNDTIINGLKGKSGQDKAQGLEQIKGRISRMIEKEMQFWDIWNEWLTHIPGISSAIAAPLILLYYYRFVPVCGDCGTKLVKQDKTHWCSKCEKSVKGEGLSQYALEYKDFPNISSWRSYMGYNIVDGKMPKRQTGVQMNWNPKGRVIGFMFGDQINRQPEGHLYADYMRSLKAAYHANPEYKDYTKGHIHNMARHRTFKLFLSHFWDVAKRLEGHEEPAKPWIIQFGGHTKYIPPYYWEGNEESKAA